MKPSSKFLSFRSGFALGALAAVTAATLTAAAEPARGAFKAEEVEAVFLVNFCHFTNWPPGSFSSAQAPVLIAVWADDDFAKLVEHAATGEHVGQRAVTVKRIQSADEARSAQLVFISNAAELSFERTFDTDHTTALLIGESTRFLGAGGHLEFVPAGRMKLRVNLDALKTTKIELNSSLLRICQTHPSP